MSGRGAGDGAAVLSFLEAQAVSHPDLASWYTEMEALYQRKLWHQLTLKLEQFLALATIQSGTGAIAGSQGSVLLPLYETLITDIESRINVLKLAHFAVIVSRQYSDLPAAMAFLESVVAKLRGSQSSDSAAAAGQPRSLLAGPQDRRGVGLEGGKKRRVEEAVLYVSMQMAALNLQAGNQRECKRLLDEARLALDGLQGTSSSSSALSLSSTSLGVLSPPSSAPGSTTPSAIASATSTAVPAGVGGEEVDPSVQASVFWVLSQYCKSRQEFAEFYRAALLYLAYCSPHALTPAFKLDLAVDLSLAALLGENVYNFGELLAHPIISVLEGSAFEWLLRLLEVFERGDLKAYDGLCQKYAAELNAQPALVANQQRLREKITVLCLLDLIFHRPAEERKIPLKDIAERTSLSLEGVELLLMKMLSAHLVEGVIDQVDSSVQVSWVQPRVLGTLPQVAALRSRLDSWLDRVHFTLLAVEAETPDLLAT